MRGREEEKEGREEGEGGIWVVNNGRNVVG
jgi:hypothetical protein